MKAKTALLIIDVQVGLLELIPAQLRVESLAQIMRLLDQARAIGAPVIYVQHHGPKGHPLEPHTPGWEIDPTVRPAPGEPVISKRASDSFFESNLPQVLSRNEITHLVVTGGMTEFCVDTTCRRAITLGYDVTLVGDAHITRDTKVLPASQVIAHHNALLDGFGAGGHFVRVKPAAAITF